MYEIFDQSVNLYLNLLYKMKHCTTIYSDCMKQSFTIICIGSTGIYLTHWINGQINIYVTHISFLRYHIDFRKLKKNLSPILIAFFEPSAKMAKPSASPDMTLFTLRVYIAQVLQ